MACWQCSIGQPATPQAAAILAHCGIFRRGCIIVFSNVLRRCKTPRCPSRVFNIYFGFSSCQIHRPLLYPANWQAPHVLPAYCWPCWQAAPLRQCPRKLLRRRLPWHPHRHLQRRPRHRRSRQLMFFPTPLWWFSAPRLQAPLRNLLLSCLSWWPVRVRQPG